jgi:hypothetical protein
MSSSGKSSVVFTSHNSRKLVFLSTDPKINTNCRESPGMITRRQSLKRLLGVAAATITAPTINRGWFQLFADSATKYSARAIDLV